MPTNAPDAHASLLNDLPDGPVRIAVTDIDGVLRGKTISKKKLQQSLEAGTGFCNVVFGWDVADEPYDNSVLSGWATGYPDATVTLDPTTLRRIPWEGDVPFLLGDFAGGSLEGACPRSLLRRVLAKAEAMGYTPQAAIEYEWWCFAETPTSLAAKQGAPPHPATPGMHGYSLLRPGSLAGFNQELWDMSARFDVPLEGLHTETGPGVYEAAVHYTDALSAADRAVCFKYLTKQVALRHGLVASFMAKWRDDLPGCGGHLHQSLVDQGTGKNVFAGSKGNELSDVASHYLAGQLYWLPKLLPLLAPNPNSYKRLVPGSWAATSMSWGFDNRTTALRVLSNRLETRLPGADANPYLVLAASLAAGLDGIARSLPLEQAMTVGNAYDDKQLPALPRSLGEAVQVLREHRSGAAELLGEGFVDHYLRTREWEVRQAQQAVTDWERRRYLEII